MKKLISDEDIIAHGRSIITAEASALTKLAQSVREEFAHAAREILAVANKGHVIVSGMGKAGFIGQKISATLASTGIPSFFLHPAEAVHGDLGRYRKHDLALILSNSGETDEVIRIVPQIKRMGCPIISITASKESAIAKYSDVVIEIGSIKEACPLGLAPTTSTTAMLAIGDALAMSILELQNFTPEQFATFHPGGKLGRQLLKVTDIMRTGENQCVVSKELETRAVLQSITATPGRPGAASIIDQTGILIGVFTDGNLRRLLASNEDFLAKPIAETMTSNPRTVSVHALAAEAMNILSKYKIDQVIVIDDHKKPVGIIDIQDLFEVKTALQES